MRPDAPWSEVSRAARRPLSGRPLRVAVVGQATTSRLVSGLAAWLGEHGFAPEIHEAPFGSLHAEMLDPDSSTHRFLPEVLVLLPEAGEVRLPGPGEPVDEALEAEVERWRALWRAAPPAHLVQGNLVLPPDRPLGHHALQDRRSPTRYLQELNLRLADALPAGASLHDTDHLAAQVGRRRWWGGPYWYLARQSVSFEALPALCRSLAARIAAALGRARKCLVLDLDDTLWGGLVGEVGPEGLALGPPGIGEAFLDFQRYVKGLKERGIVLAACTRNEEATARRVFRERPEMVLREDDFAAFVANWDTKPGNLVRLAEDLGLGLEALVFVDDSASERELVRQALPEVAVVDLPEDVCGYVEALDRLHLFETTRVTPEDARRTELYRARPVGSLDEHLEGL